MNVRAVCSTVCSPPRGLFQDLFLKASSVPKFTEKVLKYFAIGSLAFSYPLSPAHRKESSQSEVDLGDLMGPSTYLAG